MLSSASSSYSEAAGSTSADAGGTCRNSSSYWPFADSASDVLRLKFRPASVSGGEMTVQPLADGDYVVHVTHTHARRVAIAGSQG